MRGPGRLQFMFWLLTVALVSAAVADILARDWADAGLSITFAVIAGLWASGTTERHASSRWIMVAAAGAALVLAVMKWAVHI